MEPISVTSEFLARMTRQAAADKEFEDQWKMPSLDGVATDDDVFRAFETLRDYIQIATDPRYVLQRWEFMVEREREAGLLPVSQPGNHARVPHAEASDIEAELTSCVWHRVQPALTVLEGMIRSGGATPLMLSRISWLEEKLVPSTRTFRIDATRTWPSQRSVITNTEFRLKRALRRIAMEPRPQDVTSASRLRWKSSVNAFAHIFNELVTKGYFEMEHEGGKEGERNVTGFARMLLQAFDVRGRGDKPLTAEQLRVPMSSGFNRKLAVLKADKIQIPEAGKLVIPEAKDIA